MLLALDAGNSQHHIGAFEEATLIGRGGSAPFTNRPPTSGAS